MQRSILMVSLAFVGFWVPHQQALAQTPVRAVVPGPAPEPARFSSERWHDGVVDSVLRSERSLSEATFEGFYENHNAEGLWIVLWCRARYPTLENGSPEQSLCKIAVNSAEDGLGVWTGTVTPAKLRTVSIFELAALARRFNPPSCAGFNLTVPLYGVRLLEGGTTEVSGPIEAGLGGGYYFGDIYCSADFSTGPELFGYSEGLDPSGKFHLGVGAGWQLAAYRYFQFGLAIGYDLYRRTPGADATDTTPATEATTNGLLAFEDIGPRPSMTFLFTFAIVGATNAGSRGHD